MNATTYGIDLAKNVFQVHGADGRGKALVRKRLSRGKLLAYFANCPRSLIGLEACGSSNYWARQLRALGHEVRQISPQYVKPYVKTNKNDGNDAQAICEAVSRAEMRFVPIKSVEQQDVQSLHRVRERLVHDRTALVNQTRGLLREYGVFIPVGIRAFRQAMAAVLEDAENELTPRPTTLSGFPCCVRSPLCTCHRHYPGTTTGCAHRSLPQPYQPSPTWRSGRPVHRPFRGLLSVHSRYGLHTRQVT